MTGCGVSAQPWRGRNWIGQRVSDNDSRRIIRQWNLEIEDELRRAAARDQAGGRWKGVVWGALWVLWLALLVALLAHVRSLG